MSKDISLKDETITAFEECLEMHKIIINDYIAAEPDMLVEMQAANDNFKTILEDNTVFKHDRKELLQALEDCSLEEEQIPQAMDIIISSVSGGHDIYLKHIDVNDMMSYLSRTGYAVIKIDNLQQHEKLKQCVDQFIWPNHSERDNYEMVFE